MAEEPDILIPIPPTLREKLLFYVTAFFLLLGIFSVFGFLFLVPFIIEPAYTTIKMDFDENPAHCITASTERKRGLSNCSWTSCREGCTREVYECTQIIVNYKHPNIPNSFVLEHKDVIDKLSDFAPLKGSDVEDLELAESRLGVASEYDDDDIDFFSYEPNKNHYTTYQEPLEGGAAPLPRKYNWFYGARLYPNVKGCGYPPYLNCTRFSNTYVKVGTNFTCYYSRVDLSLVVTELDMKKVHMHLLFALVVPIASFVLSVIYLTFAYFYIYNDPKDPTHSSLSTQKSTPRRKKNVDPSEMLATSSKSIVQVTPLALYTPIAPPTSGLLTPASDMYHDELNSFGHQYKYAMVDDMLSRDSLDSLAFSYSYSMNGNMNKMMTTCILTPPGPIAQL